MLRSHGACVAAALAALACVPRTAGPSPTEVADAGPDVPGPADVAPERTIPVQPAVQPEPPPPRDVTIAAVGDIMMGSTYPSERLPDDDGASMLADVAPILAAADVAFGNLEGPLIDDGESEKCGQQTGAKKTCYAFRVPTRYAAHLHAAGFDVVSLANNHTFDFGHPGLASTKQALDARAIAWAGPDGKVARLSAGGRTIAVVAFATNALSPNVNDLDAARTVVADAAAGADLVVVSFHGGAEGESHQHVPSEGTEMFHGEKRGELRKFSRVVIDAGADLVIGHGPHVVRGMEVYAGRLVAYSLGNFATYGRMNLRGQAGISLVLEATLGPEGELIRGRVHPVVQHAPGGPRLDADRAVIGVLRELSSSDFGAAAPAIADDGSIAPP